MLLWHCNYHPDGGQLFYPLERKPFMVPLALPGDDVRPEHFVCFRFDGRQGLYIHPDIWHEGVFAIEGTHRFLDRQGAVHARSIGGFRARVRLPARGAAALITGPGSRYARPGLLRFW
jgi:hypothetical protein